LKITQGSQRRLFLGFLAVVSLFPLTWYTHVILSSAGDPLGRRVDFALWLASSCLKLGALAGVLWLLTRVHRTIFASRRNAAVAFAVWCAASALVVLVLASTRSWWAPALTSDASKFFYLGDTRPLQASLAERRQIWSKAWSSGEVVAAELALVAVLSGVLAAAGRYLGKVPWLSALLAVVAVDALLLGYLVWCPWFVSDYDFFHGEIFAGAVLLDQVSFVANDPYTTLVAPLYVVAFGAEWMILELCAVSAPLEVDA
jgi:hypothetical protein